MPYTSIVAPILVSLSLAATSESTAEGAALPAAGDDQDPCEAVLTRLSEAGESRGYSVNSSASGFTGTRGRTGLEARCSAGHVEIALLEVSGSLVRVNFRRRAGENFALELVGVYPPVGTVSRTAILDEASADRMRGSLNFAADAGAGSVFVEFDLAGEVLAAGGDSPGDDARVMNALFAPVLNRSEIWKDAHVLGYAAAGIWDPGMAAHESELDMILGLAIPSPDPLAKVDADSKDAVQKCGVSFTVCLAAAWFPPAGVWACGVTLASCFAALPCLPKDCAGDGV